MKRASALVSYSSSDDESEKGSRVSTNPEPTQKKRKLPPLAETVATPPPADNPALHQGRTRVTPHVEGQWAAHVYVSIKLRENSPLYQLLENVLHDSKERVQALQAIPKLEEGRSELHISLSRPIFLRVHQREELKVALRNIARSHAPFCVSFAAFSELVNDERTRTFLAMEIGAGHHELKALTDALSPALESIRQRSYYEKPRFHASIAWALLTRPAHIENPECGSDNAKKDMEQFPTIDRLPQDLLSHLNETYRPTLSSSKIGTLEVTEISVKIGKEVTMFRLKGAE